MISRLIIAGMAIAVTGTAVMSFPATRIAAWVLLGRGSVCPLARAQQAPGELARQVKFKDEILKASRKLETDPKGFELWQTPKGRYWIPKGSHFVLPFNLAEQERGIYWGGEVRVQSGDVVLDCGANVGVFTRAALDRGAGRVIAIEPAPENIECLRRNFAGEIGEGRVIVYPKGVWDKDDFLTLHVDPHNSAADSFLIQREGGVEGGQVPLTTIDKLAGELRLDRVDFIKMDIEGAEVKALQGGRAVIARFHPRLSLSAYHAKDHPVEVPKAVQAAWSGYRMECGPCAEIPFGVRPDILYFH